MQVLTGNLRIHFLSLTTEDTTDLSRKELFAKGYNIKNSRNIYSLFKNTNTWFSKHASRVFPQPERRKIVPLDIALN